MKSYVMTQWQHMSRPGTPVVALSIVAATSSSEHTTVRSGGAVVPIVGALWAPRPRKAAISTAIQGSSVFAALEATTGTTLTKHINGDLASGVPPRGRPV